MNIYVAAAKEQAAAVVALAEVFESMGHRSTSGWAAQLVDVPRGDLPRYDTPGAGSSVEALQRVAEANDADLQRADLVLVLSSAEAKETFCEARLAIHLGRLVLWVGRPTCLSSYRPNVERFEDLSGALAFLRGMSMARGDVARRWFPGGKPAEFGT